MNAPKSDPDDRDQELSDRNLKMMDHEIKSAIGHEDRDQRLSHRDRKWSDQKIDPEIVQWKQLE